MPFILRVQEALRQYLEGHISAGSQEHELHSLYVRLLALGGYEEKLLKCVLSIAYLSGLLCASVHILAVIACNVLLAAS